LIQDILVIIDSRNGAEQSFESMVALIDYSQVNELQSCIFQKLNIEEEISQEICLHLPCKYAAD